MSDACDADESDFKKEDGQLLVVSNGLVLRNREAGLIERNLCRRLVGMGLEAAEVPTKMLSR